jgi:two-component system CheB/CheR fusion protein
VLAWHGTFTDVNDQKLAQLAIERLAKEKEDFIGIAGRELKTPVTILKGSIQLLEREAKGFELSPELSNLIRMAGRQAGRLSRMVSDLLDVARLDAERIRLPKSDFLLREVIEESIEQVNHPGRRETIRVTGWTDIPVHANKERIGQVVMNFLSNAIKYSNEGSEVTITVTREEGYVRLAVEDRGVGIPKERLAFVFDRTFRVDESEKTASGLGLGLYVSAEIIALHQGEIGVNSEPGQGSVFWFRLPA